MKFQTAFEQWSRHDYDYGSGCGHDRGSDRYIRTQCRTGNGHDHASDCGLNRHDECKLHAHDGDHGHVNGRDDEMDLCSAHQCTKWHERGHDGGHHRVCYLRPQLLANCDVRLRTLTERHLFHPH